MQNLGRIEDLPERYLRELTQLNLVPLWPSLQALLPPKSKRVLDSRFRDSDVVWNALDYSEKCYGFGHGRLVRNGMNCGMWSPISLKN